MQGQTPGHRKLPHSGGREHGKAPFYGTAGHRQEAELVAPPWVRIFAEIRGTPGGPKRHR